jgi:hypothetical protein
LADPGAPKLKTPVGLLQFFVLVNAFELKLVTHHAGKISNTYGAKVPVRSPREGGHHPQQRFFSSLIK